MKTNKTTAYIMLVGAMLIFGTVGIFRRYIPISSAMLAFARGLIGSIFLFIFAKAKHKDSDENLTVSTLLLLVLTGALIGFNWIFLFEAYSYTTVSTATLCYYMEPTIVILLSSMVFREKMTVKKIICAVLAIIGMVLISGILNEFGTAANMRGILLGFGAALLYSMAVVLNKTIELKDVYKRTIIELFSAAVVLIPYILISEDFSAVTLRPNSIVLIIIMGIVHTGIAYALYFASINRLSGQSIALLSYIDPVSALVLSALILNEKMTLPGIIGAVLIIVSAAVSEIRFKTEN